MICCGGLMNKEILKHIIEEDGLLGLLAVPFFAFSTPVRREIGRRDGWTCQGLDGECVWEYIQEKPASFQDGFWVMGAHYEHNKKSPDYDTPDAGRILCLVDHYIYDRRMGVNGAEKLHNFGVYTWDAYRHRGHYPHIDFSIDTIEDVIDKYFQARGWDYDIQDWFDLINPVVE